MWSTGTKRSAGPIHCRILWLQERRQTFAGSRSGTGSDLGLQQPTPLLGAVSKGRTDAVELLLAHGADTNAVLPTDDTTAFHSAVANGFVDILKMLTATRADPNRVDRNGRTPMDCAASDSIRLQLRLALINSHWENKII
ncbi:hypothetical protein PsorP6_008573 [Peronosclerospora sorghi]|uniref:Uncharacterized protein n=1 Tax=Peronosclerospora sorghi TaxID=230839 RepID=A0ACC0WC41_9STRA|nr:hypothetical protein PsorP6_008573 [Peronosclerospora sorghi]